MDGRGLGVTAAFAAFPSADLDDFGFPIFTDLDDLLSCLAAFGSLRFCRRFFEQAVGTVDRNTAVAAETKHWSFIFAL